MWLLERMPLLVAEWWPSGAVKAFVYTPQPWQLLWAAFQTTFRRSVNINTFALQVALRYRDYCSHQAGS